MDHILSIVLFTPLAGLLVLLFLPSSNPRLIKLWANAASFIGFLVSLPLVFQFDHTRTWAFEEQASWIPSIGASYHLGDRKSTRLNSSHLVISYAVFCLK